MDITAVDLQYAERLLYLHRQAENFSVEILNSLLFKNF